MKEKILKAKVNSWLGIILLSTVALGSGYFVLSFAEMVDKDLAELSVQARFEKASSEL